MASLASIVDLIHPAASGLNIITTDQIWVLFDREIDESTVEDGNFFITGQDFDTWSGPDLQLFLDTPQAGEEDEILQSPGYHGILQGTFSFERISLASLSVVTTEDTVGSGHLYRTKAIFTPTNRLQADTDYNVYLTGDEDDSDSLQTGISSRTVFDPVASGANTGTGDVDFTGGYIGFVDEDAYRVEITVSGEVGTSKFVFNRDSDPFSVFGPFYTKRSGVLLSDGVTIEFDEGLYRVGDQWSVVVKERDIFTDNLYWPFKTGSGSIETIPTTTATSVTGDPAPVPVSTDGSTTFSVSSTTPEDEASNVYISAGEYDIVITFDDNIDPLTVVSGVDLSIYTEAATGEIDVPAEGDLIVLPTVSGKTLTATVASGLLHNNNLITVTLDSSIANTDGITLGSNYEFSFTTYYDPMYCTLRRLRLLIGAYISDVADDTINLAIHLASLEANSLTWNTDNTSDEYYIFARSQWTCCRAAQILLINTTGGNGSLKAKRLGDLEVQYNTSGDTSKPLRNAEDCLLKWEGAIMAGGRQVQSAKMVIKGDYDTDRPPVGRGWIHTRDMINSQEPIANSRTRQWYSRRFRNVSSRGWWSR